MLSTNFGGYSFKARAAIAITTLMMLDRGGVGAQIVSDGTTDTKVTVEQNISSIVGGIQSGQNLFHSFKQFSLTTDTVASFNHALDVENIFSRVTGGISEIDGLIQTQGNANLFLLNPAGIIFGANAQLDVGGSFIATSGDRLIFEDGMEFSAVNPEKPLLTMSFPIGLQYGGNAGEIAVLPNANRGLDNNGLSVRGNTLALLGGDVSINRNSLNAIGSNIEIGSVNSGSIELLPHDNGWQFDYTNAIDLGEIDLIDRALINSSGIVNLKGNTINLLTGSGIRNFTDFSGTGTITLEATESIDLNSSVLITQVGQQTDTLDKAIAGIGGDISLEASQISFSNGSVISAGTLSDGAGGNITINASQVVKLTGEVGNPSIISTSTQGIGDGGQIEVNTGSLIIRDGSQIQALAGEGAGGTITVNASEAVDISGTGILRSQNVESNLTETTKLTSGFSASSGIDGLPLVRQPQGESGNLVINTPNLTIKDEAQISVSNYGSANAGDIKINTSTLNLDTAGEIIANTASGEGGSIGIIAEELVILDRESSISTTADDDGNGGNITIETSNLVLLESNKVSADASQGNGGRIAIDTQGLFVDPSSSITASSEDRRKIGSVEIFTSDLNSRLQTDDRVQSSFTAEDRVYTGCGMGEDLTENQFRDIGRGGIPNNPMQETANREMLEDLGTNYRQTSISARQTQNSFKQSIPDDRPITEANAWIVDRGVVKLIATTATAVRSPRCEVD